MEFPRRQSDRVAGLAAHLIKANLTLIAARRKVSRRSKLVAFGSLLFAPTGCHNRLTARNQNIRVLWLFLVSVHTRCCSGDICYPIAMKRFDPKCPISSYIAREGCYTADRIDLGRVEARQGRLLGTWALDTGQKRHGALSIFKRFAPGSWMLLSVAPDTVSNAQKKPILNVLASLASRTYWCLRESAASDKFYSHGRWSIFLRQQHMNRQMGK